MASTVHVDGLKELNKALKAAGDGAEKDLRRELKQAGVIVRDEAQRIARGKNLVDTGALVRGIRIGYRRTSVTVYETASRRSSVGRAGFRRSSRHQRVASHVRGGGGIVDYPYPVVYEFGGRGQGQLGPRAFMYPALERRSDEVVRIVGRVVDEFTRASS